MFVLDTNTLIYFFKGIGNVSEQLLACSPQDIAIPSIVLFELEYGITRSTSPEKRQNQLALLSESIKILPFTNKEAKTAVAIRFQLEQAGTPIGNYDILIAATAISNNATLVTNNTKEFNRIATLQLENWL